MRVILNVESLRPPLTGIGRYTAHLLAGLLEHPGVDAVEGFLGGGFVDVAERLRAVLARNAGEGGTVGEAGMGDRVRALVRALPGAYRLRTAMRQRTLGPQMANRRGWLYHEPNFILKPHDGPMVATVHDLSFVRYPQFHPRERVAWLSRELPRTLARATRILTDSEFVRREIVSTYGIDAGRVRTVPLGVEAAFRPRDPAELAAALGPLGLAPGGYALSVATFEPRKNLSGLVSAWLRLPAALRRHRPLVLVGAPGWKQGALADTLVRAEADGSIKRLGWIDDARLPLVYAGAALFAFPSTYEGFGLPPLEAMACGVPVVASDAASLPEIVGDTGLLVDPGDEDSIARALERGLTDEAWRREASARALARARGFAWDVCVQRTVEVYREAARA